MSEFRRYGTDPRMDKLVDSKDWFDRRDAAEQGYGLEKLVNDKISHVRQEVARQNYGLDILINDEDYAVRREVAIHGYGLDILVHDEDWAVRGEIARWHGYGLDILINDIEWLVRKKVAERGYGLNILINDKSYYVCEAVSDYLKEHNYKSIDEWAAAEPEKVHNADSQDFKVKEDLKDFIYKIDDSPKLKVESSYDNIDEFFDSYTSNSNSDDFDELVICAVDTKQPIIKIQKTIKENKAEFKFLVDITDEEGNRFLIQTIIKSKEQLNSKIQETVESLRSQKEFSKYADDLESCL